ncbi:MAG TPA: DUF445 family protein, partial [Spirochaetia bacterium]|nr:DUF445 family protein [Spirochaetia bacterium]
ESIRKGISDFTSLLLSTPFQDMKKLFSPSLPLQNEGPEVLVEGFLRSAFFAENAPLLLEKGIAFILARPVNDLFTPEERAKAMAAFSSWLLSDEGKQKASDSFADWVTRLKEEGKSLGDILPADAADRVTTLIDTAYPAFLRMVSSFLSKPETKFELQIQGQNLVYDILDKLSRFQRFLVTASQYDKTIQENMPDIVDDFIVNIEESLADPLTQRNIIVSIRDGFIHLFTKPIASFDTDIPIEEKLKPVVGSVFDMLGNLVEREGDAMLSRFLEGKTIADIVGGISGTDPSALCADIAERLTESLSSASSEATGFVISLVSGMGKRRVGDFFSLDAEKKEQLDTFLTDGLVSVICEKARDILTLIDVRALVKNKIDSLDIMAVERILLDVLKTQFKWINIFGGILGGLIGMIQLAVALLF